ncbi:TPA: sulfite exporter TauE/SafE family protein [Clostridioides difficile]|nr:sulfite exporter TauE/SafE family protein [Clostridioides difficile]
MILIYFIISSISAFAGAISGIGGGVIIKPLIDSIGTMEVSTVSFLSGITVLTMASVSLLKNVMGKSKIKVETNITLYLALGSATGGVLGNNIFNILKNKVENENSIGVTQSIMLLLINIIIMIYIKNKSNIKTLNIKNKFIFVLLGMGLGLISAFLGIGGGPLNIVVLYYFLSMSPKEAAINSLFIILFSQVFSLANTIINNKMPSFNILVLVVMCLGGVLGALEGNQQSKKMNDENVEKFFLIILWILIVINVFNIIKFILI